MKLNQSTYNKFSYLTYNLINLKLNTNDILTKDFNINFYRSLDVNFKKIFKIIYEFHKYNRNIVFVGFPEVIGYNFNSLFHKFDYIFLSNKVWVNGVLCNSKSLIPYIHSKRFKNFFTKEKVIFLKNFNNLVKLKKLPDLIVLFDTNHSEKLLLEAKKMKTPIIAFISNDKECNNLTLVSNIFNFDIKHSFKIIVKVFYILLSSILFRGIKKHIK